MGNLFGWPSARATLLTLGVTAATLTPMTISTVALAQIPVWSTTPSNTPSSSANLSDVGSDYSPRPFIQTLGEKNIIAQTGNDIVSVTASSNSFTTLTLLLKTAGLTDTLQKPGPYTVFAPTDAAFAALPPGTIQQLQQPENREILIKILRYHVVPGQLTASQLSGSEVTTVENAPVNIKTDPASNQITDIFGQSFGSIMFLF